MCAQELHLCCFFCCAPTLAYLTPVPLLYYCSHIGPPALVDDVFALVLSLYVVTFMSTFNFSCVSFCFSYVYLRIMGIHKIVGFEQNYASNFKRLREKKEREGETTYYLHCFTCP